MPGAGRALSGAARAAAAAALLLAACAPPAAAAPVVDYLGTHVWAEADEDFGGFSGLELTADGSGFTALSDRGTLRWGSIHRDRQGRIAELTTAGHARLQDSSGTPLKPGYLGDAEGLAIDAQGRIFVSFEGLDRIARYDDPDGPATRILKAGWFSRLRRNQALEALAVTAAGDLLTIPESWPDEGKGFPVWRFREGTWSNPFHLPRDDAWAPVGADVGPDGRLYVLERQFRGLRGFQSRVRRYEFGEDHIGPPETLIETSLLQFDNLEGIAVWEDGQGIRITMISDDNFLFLQRTELVEYRIRD
ncbi:MAG TPA: esterase-like activity of phytase family protein [Paracoccus solventivorans]|uniref:esterase-like activity of phytase family protein n=1 Tax=Paracoccus solventivorans TaxID=53463 RepID=UPI002BA5794C|nr:esterase-like activity of phytase family protein [Paracoccus solventivorans]HMM07757.1 esterase-like activity of phytase family protein [Paracoccus solventivorans]